MSTPILTSALVSIDSALMRAGHESKGAEILLTQDLTDALGFVLEAIEAIQGAREDAHRMAGRVALDTELLDMLAPNEEPPRFEEILDLCPALRTAYYRFAKLDANGACCVFNDVTEAYEDGVFDSMCDKLANELNAACDALESGVN